MTGRVRARRRLLMFGAGAGVAPLLSLLEAEPYGPGDATLVTRDHVDEDALGAAAVDALVHQRGLRHPSHERTATHQRGRRGCRAESPIGRGRKSSALLAGDVTDVDVYVCGPIPWMAPCARTCGRRECRPIASTAKHSPSRRRNEQETHDEEDRLRHPRHPQRTRPAVQLSHVARRGGADGRAAGAGRAVRGDASLVGDAFGRDDAQRVGLAAGVVVGGRSVGDIGLPTARSQGRR
jgi:ferredoxin-NADP reductase